MRVWVLWAGMLATVFGQVSDERRPRPSETPIDVQSVLSVTGTVIGINGRPVEDALVFVWPTHRSFSVNHWLYPQPVLARSQTDADGRFRIRAELPAVMFPVAETLEVGENGANLFVWDRRHGFAMVTLHSLQPPDLKLSLTKGVMATGVVQDSRQQPVVGAMVRVLAASELVRRGRSGQSESEYWDRRTDVPMQVTTDREGFYEIGGLPSMHHMMLEVRAPGFVSRMITLNTTVEPLPDDADPDEPDILPELSVVTLERQAAASVLVRVTDSSGKPMTKGTVVAKVDGSSPVRARVQPDGMAEFFPDRLIRSGVVQFTYECDPLQPQLSGALSVDFETADSDALRPLELQLPEPRWLSGRVVDGESRRPIAGLQLRYQSVGTESGQHMTAVTITRRDGSFRMPAVRGSGRLAFCQRLVHRYVPRPAGVLKQVNPYTDVRVPDSGEPEDVTIRLGRGVIVRGQLLSPDGRPLAGRSVYADQPELRTGRVKSVTDEGGRYELPGLAPFLPIVLTSCSERGCAVRTLEPVREADWSRDYIETVDLQLEQGIAIVGRAFAGDGPVSGAAVRLHLSPPGATFPFRPVSDCRSGPDGTYRFSGLQPGQSYRIEILPRPGVRVRNWRYDEPYLPEIAADESRLEIRLPDAWLADFGQRLSGVVVDEFDEPLGGATVQVLWPQGDRLTRHDVGMVKGRFGGVDIETDADGRFTLDGLPDMPLKLRVMASNPEPGKKERSVTVSPSRNQSDVKVVVDFGENQNG